MKQCPGKSLWCTKTPRISSSNGKKSVDGGFRTQSDKATMSTDVKKTPKKQNPSTNILLGVGKALTDKSVRAKCPEHVTNGHGTVSHSASDCTSSDEEKHDNTKKVHSEFSSNSENARNRRMQLALLYTERMPHVKWGDGSRMVPWSDVKEILLPSCSDPECDIVLNALKITFRYPWSSKVMHPCSPKEQMVFLRSFRLVPPGTLLVDVREVQNKLEHIWEIVRQKHTASEDKNSLRCHYTKAQCPSKKPLAQRTDMARNEEEDYSFNTEYSKGISGLDKSATDNVQKYVSVFRQQRGSIPDIGTLKVERIIRHPLLPTEEKTTMKTEGKVPPSSSFEDEDLLKIECRNKPLIRTDENEKRKNSLLEMEAMIPVLKPDREEKTSIHDCFMVVSLAVKTFPKLKYYLLEKCREFVVGRPSSPRIKMRCCNPTEARMFTSWVLRHQGWNNPWQHVTSRDILIDCNSVVEQLKEQPSSEVIADSDTDVLVEIQTPQIKDIPELDTLEGDCSNSCDRLFGKETNNNLCYGHTVMHTAGKGRTTHLFSHVSSLETPKQVKDVLFMSKDSNAKSDAKVSITTKHNNAAETGQCTHSKVTQKANTSKQKLETIIEDECEDCQINDYALQTLANQTISESPCLSIKDRFTQDLTKTGRPTSSHQVNPEKPIEMLCREKNIQNVKVDTALCEEMSHSFERDKNELKTEPLVMDSRSTPSLANLILREIDLRSSDICDAEKKSLVERPTSILGPKASTQMYELHGDKKRSPVSYNAEKKTLEYTLVDSKDLRSFYLDDKVPDVNKFSSNLHFSPPSTNHTQGHPKKKFRIKSPEATSNIVNENQNATGTAAKEDETTGIYPSKDDTITLAKNDVKTLVTTDHLSTGNRSFDLRKRSLENKLLASIPENRSHMLARTMSETFKFKNAFTDKHLGNKQNHVSNSDTSTRSSSFLQDDEEHKQLQEAKSNEHHGYSNIPIHNNRLKEDTKRQMSVVDGYSIIPVYSNRRQEDKGRLLSGADGRRCNATGHILNRNVSQEIQMGRNEPLQHKAKYSLNSNNVEKYNFRSYAQPSGEVVQELSSTITKRKTLTIPKPSYTSSALDQKKKDKWRRLESLPSLQTKVNRSNKIETISKSSFDDTIESLQSLKNFHHEVRKKHLGSNLCSEQTDNSGEDNNKEQVSDEISPQKMNANKMTKQRESKAGKNIALLLRNKLSSLRKSQNSVSPEGCSNVSETLTSKKIRQLSNQSEEIKHIVVKIPCETTMEDTDNDSNSKIKSGVEPRKKKPSSGATCNKKYISRKAKGYNVQNVQSTESISTRTSPVVSQSESCLQYKEVLKEQNKPARKSMSAPVLGHSSYEVSVNNLKLTFHRVDEETKNVPKRDISKENVVETKEKFKNTKQTTHKDKTQGLNNTTPGAKQAPSITNCKLVEDPNCEQNIMVALQRPPDKSTATRLPNVTTRQSKNGVSNKNLKTDSSVEETDSPQDVDDCRGSRDYRNGIKKRTLVGYELNQSSSESKQIGADELSRINTNTEEENVWKLALAIQTNFDVSTRSGVGNGPHDGNEEPQCEAAPNMSSRKNNAFDGEEIADKGVHHKKKWLKDFYEEENISDNEADHGKCSKLFDKDFQSNESNTTSRQSGEMKTEIQIRENILEDNIVDCDSLPTSDYFTLDRREKEEYKWHDHSDAGCFVQYEPTIDIAEEVVVSEPQDTELVNIKQEKYDNCSRSNENVQAITTPQQSDSDKTIIFNDSDDLKDNEPPEKDLEGPIYVLSPEKRSHHGSNMIRRSARTSLSPRKSYKDDSSNEEDEDKCSTKKKGTKTKKNFSKKGKKKRTTNKKFSPKTDRIDDCLTNGKDIKQTKRCLQGIFQEQEKMMDILLRKSKEQGKFIALKDQGKPQSERTKISNESDVNKTAAMKRELIDQCAPICDSEGLSQGGLTKLEGAICPYVVMNGYKFVALVDVIKLFPNCVKKCAIPKRILMRHKGLFKTFCTWEQVYTMDLVFHQKGRFLTTGDVLLKLESVMEHLPEIKSQIKEQHRNSKLKSSQSCRYHFC